MYDGKGSGGIVIVGAGPAGAGIALALAGAGLPSILIDDNPEAGGQVFRTGPGAPNRPLPGQDPRGPDLRQALAEQRSRIDHRAGQELVDVENDGTLWVLRDGQSLERLSPAALVVATGALEVFVPVPGWTLLGVVGLGGLQSLVKSSGVVPRAPVVLGGAGPLLYLVAAQLCALDVPLAAIVDAAGPPPASAVLGMARGAPALLARGLGFLALLARKRVPVLRRSAVVAVLGRQQVEAVQVASLDRDWRPRGGVRTIAAGVVALGHGLRANTEVTRLIGCDHCYDPFRGGWRPRRHETEVTSAAGVYVAGDAGGIEGVDAALAEAPAVAEAVMKHLGHPVPRDLAQAAKQSRSVLRRLGAFRDSLESWCGLRPGIYDATTSETVICRCEEVTRATLDAALARGYSDPVSAKMFSRIGMGTCQGRVCATTLLHLSARMGVAPESMAQPSARPPLRPVPVSAYTNLDT